MPRRFTVEEIKALRERCDMSQEEFAHTLGVSVSTVWGWETGKRSPSKLALRALASLAASLTNDSRKGGS